MPHEDMNGGTAAEYDTDHERMIATKPDHVLLSIKPMTEGDARSWIVACNELGVHGEVVEHFAEEVRRLS